MRLQNGDKFRIKSKEDLAQLILRISDQKKGSTYTAPKVLSEREKVQKNNSGIIQADHKTFNNDPFFNDGNRKNINFV